MQNKGAIWLFTILLALACIFQISFSFVTSSFEKKAEDVAMHRLDSLRAATGQEFSLLEETQLIEEYKTEYLAANANTKIYPVFGYTYQESKSKQINLGLDLAGGMSVTLEVSIPDLIANLSNNPENDKLVTALNDARKMKETSQEDFVNLFGKAWEAKYPDTQLANLFHSRDNKDRFPRDASNQEILDILKEESRVAINNTERILRTRIDKFGVTQPTIQKQQFTGRILVELPGVKDKERIRKQLRSTANLEFWNTYENAEILGYLDQANTALSELYNEDFDEEEDEVAEMESEEIDEIEEDVEELLDEDGNILKTDTSETAELDFDEIDEMSEEEQLRQIPLFSKLNPSISEMGQPAEGSVVGFALLKDTAEVNRMLAERVVQDILPSDLRLLWSAEPAPGTGNVMRLFAIKVDTRDNKPPLDGSVIVDASQQYDISGRVEVSMLMNSEGARKWKEITREAASQSPKRQVAIVLDNYVYSAPVVQSEIPTGQSSISMGQGTRSEQISEALDLANLLKAGALPAPANIVDEAVIGPSLGQQNIDDGLKSFAIAFVVVLCYMIVYYRGGGIVADIALVANLFFLVGVLASLRAALTLPGIAGIVLTIGMAVDANVLIFERIREELRNGRSMKAALKEGYSKAYSAIIDGNLTTLLTAIVLLVLGSGPIKGFATTLIIGIFTSLFSAIFISRLIFEKRLQKGKTLTFWFNWSKDILTRANYAFIKNRRIGYIISGVLILISVISFATRGFSFGVDFTGGRTYTVRFEQSADLDQIRNTLATVFVEDGHNLEPEVKTFGASNQVRITTRFMVDSYTEEADNIVEQALNDGLDQLNDPYNIMESRRVDPSVSDDFVSSSTSAVLFAVLIMFAYIVFRFRKWQYGVGAVVSTAHDVIIVMGVYSLFYGILPFSLEIDQAFIAAILTVVGYTINDTVIVFDRIREYVGIHRKEPIDRISNAAINDTLSRTINTSMTTFVVLLTIFIFGGESIRGFVFALALGVIVGTYSSIYIAAPVMVDLTTKTGTSLEEPEKKKKEAIAS